MAEDVKATEAERCDLCGRLKIHGDHEKDECNFWARVRRFSKAANGGIIAQA